MTTSDETDESIKRGIQQAHEGKVTHRSFLDPEDTLLYWAERYVQVIKNYEEHPEDPHGEAEIEYCEDNMRRHLLNLDVVDVGRLKEKFGQGVEESRP